MTASEGKATLCSGEDYIRHFDPNAFIGEYYFDEAIDESDLHPFVLSKLHDFYAKTAQFRPNSAFVLEFGGGATVSHLISCTQYASTIVLADYTPASLETMDRWRKTTPSNKEEEPPTHEKKSPTPTHERKSSTPTHERKSPKPTHERKSPTPTHDWTSFFRYVVRNLETNDDDEAPARRAAELRVKLSSLVPCNILDDEPLRSDGYDRAFDVVSSSFCLEVACRTRMEFKSSVKKLAALLKGSGSWLVLNCVLGENSYPVGDKVFFALSLTDDVVKEALDEAGFRLVEFESIALRQKVEGLATAACHAVGQLK